MFKKVLALSLAQIDAIRRSPKWAKARRLHLVGHPSCEACGSTLCLQVHHIKPFHVFPALELVESNFITLCEPPGSGGCHLRIGHLGNWRIWNSKIVSNAKRLRLHPDWLSTTKAFEVWLKNSRSRFKRETTQSLPSDLVVELRTGMAGVISSHAQSFGQA